jgi:hypothetical protein
MYQSLVISLKEKKYRNRCRRLKGEQIRHGATVLFSLWLRQELILRSHLGVIHKMHD